MRALGFMAVFAALAGTPEATARRPLAHFYYVDDAAAWQSLERNWRYVELLSPVWVFVDSGGEVRLAVDPKVRQLAVDKNIALMPVVMNADFKPEIARAALATPESISALAAKLAATAADNRFQGLQLDLENLEASDRDGYSRLAETLAPLLHKRGMKLSVAVAAPVYSTGPVDEPAREYLPAPRAAAFDYARLGAAADFLTLMSYDQYATADAPGPIAGVEWMEQCVRRVFEAVPAEKLTLGLALYHRRWNAGKVTTGSWAEAQAEANKANVASKLHDVHKEPVLRMRTDGGETVIWFQDSESLRLRTELVAKYRLRGYSVWRMGQEDPSVWPRVFAPKCGVCP
ncbi:MAG: glycosyl hydrolase family 18 protein [Bryobacteraceae bacterium]